MEYVYIHVYIYVCMWIFVYTHVNICVHAARSSPYVYICIDACIYIPLYKHTAWIGQLPLLQEILLPLYFRNTSAAASVFKLGKYEKDLLDPSPRVKQNVAAFTACYHVVGWFWHESTISCELFDAFKINVDVGSSNARLDCFSSLFSHTHTCLLHDTKRE